MIKKFVIKKLTEWLELENIKSTIKENYRISIKNTGILEDRICRISDKTNLNQSQIHNINELFSVAADVGYQDHKNWAVICIEGKPNFVKFVDLTRGDVKGVQNFLRQFECSRRVVDAPYHMDFMFSDDELWRVK